MVGRWAFVIVGLLFVLSRSWYAGAQAPLPILRGIVVMPTGDSRAYFEDPQTGNLGGYAIGDVVGDSRIEEIRDDRVVLRHGGNVIQALMGGAAVTDDPGNRVSPSIGGGEPWLEHLGIPPKALSRAIEATPTKGSDNLED